VTPCSSMFHCCNPLFAVYSGSGSIQTKPQAVLYLPGVVYYYLIYVAIPYYVAGFPVKYMLWIFYKYVAYYCTITDNKENTHSLLRKVVPH
jgi:hypothetical protein